MSAVGTWNGDAPKHTPNLTLSEDGRLTGTDGCNRLFGSWKEEADGIVFVQVASTMMLCHGVNVWLSKLATASIDGDTMTVQDSEGEPVGTLTRVDVTEDLEAFRDSL